MRKYFFLLCVMVGMIMLLCSCGDNKPQEEEKVVQSEEPSNTEPEEKLISIYGVDTETMERVAMDVSVAADQKVTPQLIVDEVSGNFQEELGISEVREEEDKITVCFQAEKAPLANVSGTMENIILDCIAFSLLDNISSCKEIYFEGENGTPYESGHNAFALGEVYVTK